MKSIKVFISSVQAEFSKERVLLCDYIRRDALLGRFFEPFLFEELPAINKSAVQVYLPEVEHCDIFLGLLGNSYGNEDIQGISPTEREFDVATANCKHRIVFIKKSPHDERQPKEQTFIKKVESSVVRKSFLDFEELRSAVYAALVHYLDEKEYLRMLPFDATNNATATLNDIDVDKVNSFVGIAKEKRGLSLSVGSSVETVLTHLDLITTDGKITNAALLLFGKQPQKFFISSEIKCAHFYGNEVTKPIPSYQVYRGDVFQLVNQAVDFVLSRIDARVGDRSEGVQVNVDWLILCT